MNMKKESYAGTRKKGLASLALAVSITGGGAGRFAGQNPPVAGNTEKQMTTPQSKFYSQHQGADTGGAGASQAIDREIDGGTERDRGVGEGLRVPIQPRGRVAAGAGGLGGSREQVLPVS
jgi:hypothetical protein